MIHEFGITGDFDTGELIVDTNSRSFANRCRRKGMTEISSDQSFPYWRFRGSVEQVGVLKPRHLRKTAARKLTDGERTQAIERLRSATAKRTRKPGPGSTQNVVLEPK